MRKKIVIVGPAYPYRGGIAAFNERLARQFAAEGCDVETVTFTLQYPSFLFPGKSQYSEDPAPEDLAISRRINSVNPFSWFRAGREIRRKHADRVIIAYWHPYMSPALGTVARLCGARVTGLVHNLIPHEHKPGDRLFARYFCSGADDFITLSAAVANDIASITSKKTAVCSHPTYDNFGEAVSKDEACARLRLDSNGRILLSFGLIRDYKGLDWLLEAYSTIRKEHPEIPGVKLVVAGEFYSNPEKYHGLARDLGIDGEIEWRTEFIPDSEVKYYFSAADLIVQPYKSATQSGVTQIAYNFEKPMLVTDVGGLSETVPDGVAGYVVKPDPKAVANAILTFLEDRPDFSEGLREQRRKYSWSSLTKTILDL